MMSTGKVPSQNAASSPSPRGSSGASASYVDPNTLMRIKNLQLRAQVVVEGFFHGLHRSPYHGFSVEFSEYRQYTPGDDPRYLDWRLYARTDRYYIKRFEDETNLRCYLLVDMSRSMGYGSLAYHKAEYAKTVAATLAYFLAAQRDAVGLLTFDRRILEYLPARFRPGHLHRLMLSLDHSPSGTDTDLGPPLEQIARTVTKRGLIVLVSDLLTPIATLESHLGYVKSRGHEVVLMRVLDPREVDFQFSDAAMFRDVESDRSLYIDPHQAREGYLRSFREHERTIVDACARLGIDYLQLLTDRPLELALFDFLNARVRRGKTAVRRASTRGTTQAQGGHA